MMEEWKDIPGYYPYQASNLGRVRGLRGIRKPYVTPSGYLTIMLNINGSKVNRFVHYLVLKAWVGDRPQGMEICHRDNIKTNNKLSNLRYDTRSENRKDSLIENQSPKAKLTVREVFRIRESSDSPSELSKEFGISLSSIYRIKRRDTWKI